MKFDWWFKLIRRQLWHFRMQTIKLNWKCFLFIKQRPKIETTSFHTALMEFHRKKTKIFTFAVMLRFPTDISRMNCFLFCRWFNQIFFPWKWLLQSFECHVISSCSTWQNNYVIKSVAMRVVATALLNDAWKPIKLMESNDGIATQTWNM